MVSLLDVIVDLTSLFENIILRVTSYNILYNTYNGLHFYDDFHSFYLFILKGLFIYIRYWHTHLNYVWEPLFQQFYVEVRTLHC